MLISKTSIADNIRLSVGAVILIFVALVASSSGQQTTALDGTTPPSLAPGTPTGSYDLSDFEHLNLFNGNLNVSLKLLNVSGRGGAGYTVTLPIESHWHAVNSVSDPLHDGNLVYSSWADTTWWDFNGTKPGYGPGVVQRRTAATQPGNCNPELYGGGQFNSAVLTRITFTAPDGSEHELVDAQTGGAVHIFGICGSESFSRGKVFTSNDGAAMTFIANQVITENNTNYGTDVVSGVLFFANGTRYQITDGLVQSLTDRNGNTLQFQYVFDPSTFTSRILSVTDSLNRQVSFSYANNSTVFYDQISFKGTNGLSRSIKIWHSNLGQALRANYSLQTYHQLFPEHLVPGSNTYNPIVISSVELPDGRKFDFRYNPYGELARVVLPTAGAVEYDHTPTSGVLCYTGDCTMSELYRRVVERRVYPDATSSVYESKTTYDRTLNNMVASGPMTVSHFNSAGTLLAQEKHYFNGNAVAFSLQPVYWSAWTDGREFKIEQFSVTDGVVGPALRRIEFTWKQQAPVSWCGNFFFGCTADSAPPNNPRLVETTETLLDTNQSSKKSAINPQTQEVGFDQYNNQTDLWEYDYDGSLKRHTHTTYLTSGYDTVKPSTANPDPAQTVHIRNLPIQVSLYDAGGTERARTTLEYDNYNGQQSNHAGLVTRSSISGLATSSTASYTTRGNVTATTNYFLVNGSVTGSITAYDEYDVAGDVVKAIDARGNATTFWFTDSIGAQDNGTPDDFGTPDGNARMSTRPAELNSTNQYAYAFPVRVTNALGQSVFTQRDFYTTQAVDQEDINGIVSSVYTDNDLLERPKRIIRAVNGGADTKSETTFDYDDTHRIVTTTSDQTTFDDKVLKTDFRYDGLGRTTETRQYEGGGNYITVRTEYDAFGRAYKVSNPFRLNETLKWTTRGFDALGRLTSITTPDTAQLGTSFSGNTVTITDQAGKSRKTVTDGLGRLVEVDEDPGGPLHYQTTYAYDVLDDLTTVTQGAQIRTFGYDSLKRLKSATNPESGSSPQNGTVTYDYDNNSNLTQRIDARGVVSTIGYDELNRVTSINYSNTTIGSPDVADITRVYDGASNGKGRLWYSYAGGNQTVGSNVEKTLFDSYDALGRPLVLKQLFKVNGVWKDEPYPISRTYNLAGAVTSQSYPSGHSVNYNYDSAGRLADNGTNLAFTGNLGDGGIRTYSRGITYMPAGQMQQEQFGTTTAVYNKLFYNSRQQLAEILESTTGGDNTWNRGKIVNSFSLQCSGANCDATDNNGNLRKQEVDIPAIDQMSSPTSWYQQYDYDNVNRLLRVHEYTGDVNKDWQQEYVYDRWGNRTINQNASATFGTNIPKPNYTVDPSNNNRLIAPPGFTMTYDLAGNVLTDTYNGPGARVYDAENRITQANDGNTQYTYNAEGQRDRRKVGAAETWQIYGFDGDLLAEYPANGAANNPSREYGYRNGQLLITTAAGSAGWGAPPAFQDNPIVVAETLVRSVHITELRSAIDAVRSHFNLGPYTWQTAAGPGDLFSIAPIQEMRTALDQALGAPVGGYAAGLISGQPILKLHIQELRDRVLAVWQGGGAPLDIRWLVLDHLGTPRMVFDQSGALTSVKRHDYLPFGEELVTQGLRNTSGVPGYGGGDGVRQQFTAKERDTETGLDYFNARYYSSAQGRFASIDPYVLSMRTSNPQSFNRYSYVENNPLRFVDPTGLDKVAESDRTAPSHGNTDDVHIAQVEEPEEEEWDPEEEVREEWERGTETVEPVPMGHEIPDYEEPGISFPFIVFRFDSRSPSEIFPNGFTAKGGNMDLIEHVARNPSNSGYIGTTADPTLAQEHAEDGEWIYFINPEGSINVNQQIKDNPFSYEREFAFPNNIPKNQIIGAIQVQGHRPVPSTATLNPTYTGPAPPAPVHH